MKNVLRYGFIGAFCFGSLDIPVFSITVAEKLASIEGKTEAQAPLAHISSFNSELKEANALLKSLYDEALSLRSLGETSQEVWNDLRDRLISAKQRVRALEDLWSAEVSEKGGDPEDYALWNHPETTIYNLVSDYGDEQSIYLIPQNVGAMRITAMSKLVVPKEGFEECLSLLLARLGIGVRQVSPWIKELYLTSKEETGVVGIFGARQDLDVLPSTAHIAFVLSSKNLDARSDVQALRKFANSDTMLIDFIGGKIWLFGVVHEITELLKIYEFLQSDNIRQEHRIVSLSKIDPFEMLAILKAAFREDLAKEGEDSAGVGLKVVPLQNHGRSLFLSGALPIVQKAIDLIRELEEGIENPTDKTVFWYNVKHSDPQELAALLSQVHDIFSSGSGIAGSQDTSVSANKSGAASNGLAVQIDTSIGGTSKEGSTKYGSFIADSKTGTLIMVIEKEALPKIKMLLKKLDVPKKMVRIEVLLFERKLSSQRKSGLNLLRLGEEVCKQGTQAVSWANGGILEFLFKGGAKGIVPSYDFAYQFLMAQEDVRINASPSVVTMNQTPARIAIVEEMSIAVSSEKDKAQYNRAQYGIMIKILPVINIGEEDGKSFITLETDITFDSTGKNQADRPDVTRRNITNKVRIQDGETVIIGGLRCNQTMDSRDGIPFLGELPGIGKLFGMDATSDSQTEMFMFITPKILDNPVEEEEKLECAFLASRPGENEDFLRAVVSGQQAAKQAMEKKESIAWREETHSLREGVEYDGRE
ncbi:type II secretion system protein GspD [Chlamydia muridarum str. Nigg]|uniref:General secretion pathway protein GspD n=2 Tax=Chlamydia muridarum TaxID=83560 RepID=A0A069ZTG6_CHLMR|nr:type II secretion system protein GspD [Chlamydia muridarum]UFT54353.1 type II secretion system protein GspD [Chlamydia trachomatis]AAF39657.1 general secretion pathway protein D [Chlamydia muridarum str. Nigg]AHH23247.1 general secretion pathway protein D [Chlamydia muridarum str. Nigg3 CMUT3-5]AHH24173.1 general secretion pathway protein D [Chlamydia muridarum str. Nigg CM972]AID38373.1 general secretion pathway protein GspD [Chlamydia muridarum str. Nigg 2 MCR]